MHTAMSAKEPAHLVLSAGGVRCLAYIGALECLTEHYRFETVSAWLPLIRRQGKELQIVRQAGVRAES
jgi:hypothetical protein